MEKKKEQPIRKETKVGETVVRVVKNDIVAENADAIGIIFHK